MGGPAKFFLLLAAPLPLLNPRSPILRLASRSRLPKTLLFFGHHATLSHSPPHHLGFRFRASRRCLHIQSALRDDRPGEPSGLSPAQVALHPLPEWSRLVDSLASYGYFDRQRFGLHDEDMLASPGDLPEEFVRAAESFLAFARNRPNLLGSLSKRDMEVVVESGAPYLFRNAVDPARRMRSFLGSGESNVLERDVAHTVDLVKFLLSCMSNPTGSLESSVAYNRQLVESSVRNILSELSQAIHGALGPDLSATARKSLPGQYGLTSRPVGQNIEMKRGDWICPRCNFMNFARNVKCLECEEARPKRQLTGGEWECPQCDFYNYGRNMFCLRCECKRPGEVSVSAGTGLGFGNTSYPNKADSRLAPDEGMGWFNKVSSLENSSVVNSAKRDEEFPEIMPLRKGVNRFVSSTRKTPLERRLANSQYRSNLSGDSILDGNDAQAANNNMGTVSRRLDEILRRESAGAGTDNKSSSGAAAQPSPSMPGQSSQQYGRPKASGSGYVPFVPFPPDMFAKKSPESNTQARGAEVTNNHDSATSSDGRQSFVPLSNGYSKSGNILHSSSQENHAVSTDKEREEAEKSETWFQRVAKLNDVTNTPDSGRMLSSEISSTSQLENSTKNYDAGNLGFNKDHALWRGNQQSNLGSWNMTSPEWSPKEGTLHQNFTNPQATNRDSSSSHFAKLNATGTPNLLGSTLEPSQNQNNRENWSGKSLEGSGVKEPDPLDMSEEAKTERWFRRVAQIKDISELSQIPDEDFPSIMPMRKGVNRFVVSRRKTPMERRLTSAQYRRNLPVMNSEPPVKNENDRS